MLFFVSRPAHIHGSSAGRPPAGRAAPRDWTTGPAKAVAVLVLGSASVIGICYAVLGGGRVGGDAVLSRAAAAKDPDGSRTNLDSAAPVEHDEGAGDSTGSAAPPKSKSKAAAGAGVKLVNLNTAGESELQLLPGIGPALAARIIADREAHGEFKSVDDLDRIKGIGPRTIDKLRSLACVK